MGYGVCILYIYSYQHNHAQHACMILTDHHHFSEFSSGQHMLMVGYRAVADESNCRVSWLSECNSWLV